MPQNPTLALRPELVFAGKRALEPAVERCALVATESRPIDALADLLVLQVRFVKMSKVSRTARVAAAPQVRNPGRFVVSRA